MLLWVPFKILLCCCDVSRNLVISVNISWQTTLPAWVVCRSVEVGIGQSSFCSVPFVRQVWVCFLLTDLVAHVLWFDVVWDRTSIHDIHILDPAIQWKCFLFLMKCSYWWFPVSCHYSAHFCQNFVNLAFPTFSQTEIQYMIFKMIMPLARSNIYFTMQCFFIFFSADFSLWTI